MKKYNYIHNKYLHWFLYSYLWIFIENRCRISSLFFKIVASVLPHVTKSKAISFLHFQEALSFCPFSWTALIISTFLVTEILLGCRFSILAFKSTAYWCQKWTPAVVHTRRYTENIQYERQYLPTFIISTFTYICNIKILQKFETSNLRSNSWYRFF